MEQNPQELIKDLRDCLEEIAKHGDSGKQNWDWQSEIKRADHFLSKPTTAPVGYTEEQVRQIRGLLIEAHQNYLSNIAAERVAERAIASLSAPKPEAETPLESLARTGMYPAPKPAAYHPKEEEAEPAKQWESVFEAMCPCCGNSLEGLSTHSAEGFFNDGDDVRCVECAFRSSIIAYGPEEIDFDRDGNQEQIIAAAKGLGLDPAAPTVEPHTEAKPGDWKLEGHSHQIADTGDYDGCYEITNGKISILTKDDDEDALLPIVRALNNSECRFYQDDAVEFENQLLKDEIAGLRVEPHTYRALLEEVYEYALNQPANLPGRLTMRDKVKAALSSSVSAPTGELAEALRGIVTRMEERRDQLFRFAKEYRASNETDKAIKNQAVGDHFEMVISDLNKIISSYNPSSEHTH